MKTDTELEIEQIMQNTIGEYPFVSYKVEKQKGTIEEERFVLYIYLKNKSLIQIKIYKENFRWYINTDENIYKIFSDHLSENFWLALSLHLLQNKF